MTYKPDRDESENVIRMLCEHYPKCFFEDPKLRKPLKKTIMTDLERNGFPVAYELLSAAIEWYQSHFAYQYSLQTGASRIDLQGKAVSTVTEQEYNNAHKRIQEDKKRLNERNLSSSTQTVNSLYRTGRITDDQVKKLDAPSMTKNKTAIAPELGRLHEALAAANATLTGQSDPALRSAIAGAALGIVIKEAQRAIDAFQEEQ